MCGTKIPQQDFALKVQGGLMRKGGIFAGHYSKCQFIRHDFKNFQGR